MTESNKQIIRSATDADAVRILEIYAPYILHSPFTFETTVPSEDEFRSRMRAVLKDYSWLVCEVDGVVAGYAYGSRHRERAAYKWSVDVGLYISKDHQRSGIGRKLYDQLFTNLAAKGYYQVFAGITIPNDPSVLFHKKIGFSLVGTYRDVGYKLGAWHDVGWWQKQIRVPESPPQIPY